MNNSCYFAGIEVKSVGGSEVLLLQAKTETCAAIASSFLFNHALDVTCNGGRVLYFRKDPFDSMPFLNEGRTMEDCSLEALRSITLIYAGAGGSLIKKIVQNLSAVHCAGVVVDCILIEGIEEENLRDLAMVLALAADSEQFTAEKKEGSEQRNTRHCAIVIVLQSEAAVDIAKQFFDCFGDFKVVSNTTETEVVLGMQKNARKTCEETEFRIAGNVISYKLNQNNENGAV